MFIVGKISMITDDNPDITQFPGPKKKVKPTNNHILGDG